MNIKEKISQLLEEIDELSIIALKDEPIKIHVIDLIQAISADSYFEIKQILLKLKEEKVIKIIQIATDTDKVTPPDGYYGGEEYYFILQKDENFNNYYKNLEKELYPEKSKQKNEETAYEVTYKERKIFINNFLIAKVDFDSVNERVFSYLYKNHDKKISVKELAKEPDEKIVKSLHHIVRDLGFTGNLRTLFFNVSKTAILFRKKITFQDLKDLNVDFIRIQEKNK